MQKEEVPKQRLQGCIVIMTRRPPTIVDAMWIYFYFSPPNQTQANISQVAGSSIQKFWILFWQDPAQIKHSMWGIARIYFILTFTLNQPVRKQPNLTFNSHYAMLNLTRHHSLPIVPFVSRFHFNHCQAIYGSQKTYYCLLIVKWH